ncbi:MAG: hypothetical protein IT196_02850 [Acidimicrobiales bacterium]|nr:hypothetical protein [Acidimicrobiales bacterium]
MWPAAVVDAPPLVSDHLERGFGNSLLTDALDELERDLRSILRGWPESAWRFPDRLFARGNWDELWAAIGPIRSGDDERTHIHKLLTAALMVDMDRAGFDFSAGLARPIGFVKPDTFYKRLESGSHMKDPLVGLMHGEWTHMLQWWLLTKKPPVVGAGASFDPVATYRYLINQGDHQRKVPAGDPRSGPDLWFVCCDRNNPLRDVPTRRATNVQDCRSPDVLHIGLAGFPPSYEATMASLAGENVDTAAIVQGFRNRVALSRQRWPLLCVLLRRRLIKRDELYRRAEAFAATNAPAAAAQIGAALFGPGAPPAAAKLLPLASQDLVTFARGKSDKSGHVLWQFDWDALKVRPGATLDGADRGQLWNALGIDVQPYLGMFREGALSLLYVWSKDKARRPGPGVTHDAAWAALSPAERLELCTRAYSEFL